MPEVPLELHVGDVKRISHLFQKQTRIEVQPLTGYSAEITFAYVNTAPHIIRPCVVDETYGLAIYEMQGDELTTVGTVEFYFTIVEPTTFVRTSSEVMRILVRRKPT